MRNDLSSIVPVPVTSECKTDYEVGHVKKPLDQFLETCHISETYISG
jgi:hypothetical protein